MWIGVVFASDRHDDSMNQFGMLQQLFRSHREVYIRVSPTSRGPAGGAAAAVAHRRAADESYADLVPIIHELRSSGKSLQAIANHLNRIEHTTRRAVLVMLVCHRHRYQRQRR